MLRGLTQNAVNMASSLKKSSSLVMKLNVTRLEYCQCLLDGQINYTLTKFADHTEKFWYDQINRYLSGKKITPRLIWENLGEPSRSDDRRIFNF
jgi:hypothetical protein